MNQLEDKPTAEHLDKLCTDTFWSQQMGEITAAEALTIMLSEMQRYIAMLNTDPARGYQGPVKFKGATSR